MESRVRKRLKVSGAMYRSNGHGIVRTGRGKESYGVEGSGVRDGVIKVKLRWD